MININDGKEVSKYLKNSMSEKEISKMTAKERKEKAQEFMTPEERKVLNVQNKFKLNNYTFDSVYNAPYYKEAANKIERLHKYIENGMRYKGDRPVLLDTAQKTARGIMRKYKKGIGKHIAALEEWQQNYITAFNNERANYQNPQETLLQRQDYENMINSMNDRDLKDYIKNINHGTVLNDFEVNYLLNRVKDNDGLHGAVMSYKESNNIGKEYKNTNEWKEVQSSLGILRVYKESPFFYKAPEDGESISRKSIDVTGMGNRMLGSYTAGNNLQAESTRKIEGGEDLFASEDE